MTRCCARAGLGAKRLGRLQHHHLAPGQRQHARHRQADHAGADDDRVHWLCTHVGASNPCSTHTAFFAQLGRRVAALQDEGGGQAQPRQPPAQAGEVGLAATGSG